MHQYRIFRSVTVELTGIDKCYAHEKWRATNIAQGHCGLVLGKNNFERMTINEL